MSTRQIIEVAIFTAVAVILTMISIPMPIPAMQELGLKIDISVVFIFLVFYRQGSKGGFISLFITMACNEFIKPSPFFIGPLAYITAFLVFYYTLKNKHFIRAIIVTSIVMTIANFFIITPAYTLAFGGLPQPYFEWLFSKEYIVMIISIYPLFNLIQWSINGFIISKLIKK